MNRSRLFHDRADAGRALGPALRRRALHRPLVLGLPRGGVPVACEVAKAIHADLDVLVVRKLGVPYHPELAFGAIASGRRVLVAVPTGSTEAVKRVSDEADDVICLVTPAPFIAVGTCYERFDQTTDEEVRRLLDQARHEGSVAARTRVGAES